MHMRNMVRIWAVLLVLAFVTPAVAKAASRDEVVRRLEDFRQFFIDFQFAPDNAIPGDLLAECHGVIIMRQYKAGFVLGVKGGDGVIFLHDRDTGEWSAPAFVVSGEGSLGFQIGGQAIDAIILIMNRDGVDMLLKTRFKIGVDASAAAGPVGRDASAQVGPGTALLAYSRSKGLYAGASFEGGAVLNYDKYNRAMYGMDVGIKDILINRMVAIPPEAVPMIETLKSYAVRSAVTPPAEAGVPPAAPRPAARAVAWSPPAPRSAAHDSRPAVNVPQVHPIAPPEPELSPVHSQRQVDLDEAAARAAESARQAAEAARVAAEAANAAAARAEAAKAAARGGR